MVIAFETGLVILFLSLIALGIAVLGDHVAQALTKNDTWPSVKPRRRAAARRLRSQ